MAVTAVTKVSYAHHGLGGLRSSLMYASSGKPHFNHGVLRHRCFIIRGFNCSDNSRMAYREMSMILNRSENFNRSSISAVRDIESFSPSLDWRSRKDRNKAYQIDLAFVRRHFKRCAVLICGQCDNNNGLIHFHNIVCPRRYTDGKSITNKCGFKDVATDMDRTLKQFGYTPLNYGNLRKSKFDRNCWYYALRGRSFVGYLSRQIERASCNALNSDDFAINLAKNNIQVERFKMRKINGKRVVKTYSKSVGPEFKKLKSGKYVRFRKHWSYRYKYNGRNLIIRDRKLGSDFSKHSLIHKFKANRISQFNRLISNNLHIQHLQNQYHQLKNKRHTFKPIIFGLKKFNEREKDNQFKQSKIMKNADITKIYEERVMNVQAKINEIADEVAYFKLVKKIRRDLQSHEQGLNFER